MKTAPLQTVQDFINFITNESNSFIASAGKAVEQLKLAPQQDQTAQLSYEILADLCESARELSGKIHRLKFAYDWELPPGPEWMDHFIDQHLQFRLFRNSLWVERGVYGVLALKQGARILELCCGDGFNAYHFYSLFAESIIAVDFDDTALAHARRYNAAPNIEHRRADIRTEMPEGSFTNITWDAAIEHFTEDEIAGIMAGIKQRLAPGGILSGYTLVERNDGQLHLHQHEREFHSKQDLADFLKPYFAHVQVFETIFPMRHNLYFWASDSAIPFHPEWDHGQTYENGKLVRGKPQSA